MEDEATIIEGQDPSPTQGRGGRVLAGRYRVLAMLGAGGMGSVFLALDMELGERVAVKMLHPEMVANTQALEWFRSEVRLARRVTHRNVARTYDIGEDGERFLTMEFVDGESLAKRLRRDRTLLFPTLVSIAEGIAAGLAAAHEVGIVHRDLKPQNVMLAEDGRVVLTDFGVAFARDEPGARDELLVGTPSYMAPEQLSGGAIDERVDLYAFGTVMYQMATGRLPFAKEGDGKPPDPRDHRPTLPAAFVEIVRACLEPDPHKRCASAADVKRALGSLPSELMDAPPGDPRNHARALVRDLGLVEGRLVVVHRPVAAPALETIATWLRGALAEALGENALLRAATADDPRAEVVVDWEVTGTDDHLYVTVRLLGNRDTHEFWGGSFEAHGVDLGQLPVQIAHAVEAVLAVDVPVAPDLPPLPPACVAPYLRARTALTSVFGENVDEAERWLEIALAEAPDHPLLLSAKAYASARLAFWRTGALKGARAAAERAVAIAPRLAESHLARANVAWQGTDACGVLRSIGAALAVAPGHPMGRYMLAQVVLEAGAPVDALGILRNVLARAPWLHRARIDIAQAFALRGDHERATRALDEIPTTDPAYQASFVYRCRHAMWRGDRDAARRAVESAAATAPATLAGSIMELFALALEGRSTRLFPTNHVAGDGPGHSPRRKVIVLQTYAEFDAYNEHWDLALDHLETAVAHGLQDAFWFDRCSSFDELRGSARFESLRSVVRERAESALATLDELRPNKG